MKSIHFIVVVVCIISLILFSLTSCDNNNNLAKTIDNNESEYTDRDALLAFLQQLQSYDTNAIHTTSGNWTTTTLPCADNWKGITCDYRDSVQRVVQIELVGCQLKGTIAKEIVTVNKLTRIQFFNNSLSGTLPTEFALFPDLQDISMGNNVLSGTVPSEYGNLFQLTMLYFASNHLNGTIPTELGRLQNLRLLFLRENAMTGTLPTEIGALLNLSYLYLNYNNLTGNLPTELGQLTLVKYCDVSRNSFAGKLPTEIGNMSDLLQLFLNSNNFRGPLPSEIGRLTHMEHFYVNDNYFNGSIPSEFGNMGNITLFHVFNNHLSSSLPSEIGNFTKVEELMIFANSLTGTLPIEMSSYANLRIFNAEGNHLSGTIPMAWDELKSLKYMLISNSGLNCTLPTVCRMSLLVYQGFGNTLVMKTQPPAEYGNSGTIYASVETWYCKIPGNCDFSPGDSLVVFSSVLVKATIEPVDQVRPYSASSSHGLVAESRTGVAEFNSIQFLGILDVDYRILFTAPGFTEVRSSVINIEPCEERLPNSKHDKDPYVCACNQGYYRTSSGNECVKCPRGTYKNASSAQEDLRGPSACESCPKNSDTLTDAQVSIYGCWCNKEFFPHANYSTVNCLSCYNYKFIKCDGQNGTITTNADLAKNSGISVDKGYWLTTNHIYFSRHQNKSNQELWFTVAKCSHSSTCPGGNITEACKEKEQTGFVCSDCIRKFAKRNDGKCVECANFNLIMPFIPILSMTLLSSMVYYFRVAALSQTGKERNSTTMYPLLSPRNSSQDQHDDNDVENTSRAHSSRNHHAFPSKPLYSVYFEILLHFIQTSVFAVEVFPNKIVPHQLAEIFGLSLKSTLTVCLFNTMEDKIILAGCLPIIATGMCLLYAIIAAKIHQIEFQSTFGSVLLSVLSFLHPVCVEQYLQGLNCRRVLGTGLTVMHADYRINCNSIRYTTRILPFSLSMLLIFGIISPSVTFLYFVRNVDPNTVDVKSPWYSISKSFKTDYYWWEVVITFRQLLIAILTILISDNIAIFLGAFALVILKDFTAYLRPFANASANRLEFWAHHVMIVIMLGAVLVNLKPQSDIAIALLLLALISGFVSLLVLLIFKNYRSTSPFLQKYTPELNWLNRVIAFLQKDMMDEGTMREKN